MLVPVYRELHPKTERALSQLADRGYVVRLLRGSSQVDLARGTLAQRALEDGFAETMWIDADIVFAPADVDKLRGHNRPFTAGLYVNKKSGQGFAAKFKAGTAATFGTGGGLIPMVGVGAGFMHVRREVYEAITAKLKLPLVSGGYEGEKFRPFFLPLLAMENDCLSYRADDYAFCHRATVAGFPPFADTTIRLGHVGSHEYTWSDLVRREQIESFQVGAE